jgi:hypothetical protein
MFYSIVAAQFVRFGPNGMAGTGSARLLSSADGGSVGRDEMSLAKALGISWLASGPPHSSPDAF